MHTIHSLVWFELSCRAIWPTPDSKVHGATIGSSWGRQDPDGPHVGPMNFAISDSEAYLQRYFAALVLLSI